MTEIWIRSYNPKYQEENTCAYYDGDAMFDEIVKDLKTNKYEIRNVEYTEKGSMSTFIITVV